MSFLVGILTLVLVLNCALLILLVLVQLPKKDAGAGMAFGAGTADALFGAGSGNALTKITKYGTGVFLVLALGLGKMQDIVHRDSAPSEFTKQLQQKQMQTPALTAKPAAQPVAPATSPLLTTPATTTNAEK